MKITCTKCGKRFDAEDHLYICPKCNHYHSQTGAHGHSRETISSSNLFEKKSDTTDLFSVGDYKSDDTNDDQPEFIQTLNGEQKVYTAVNKKANRETEYNDLGTTLRKTSKVLSIILCVAIFLSTIITGMLDRIDFSGFDDSTDTEYEIFISENGTLMEFDTFEVKAEKADELISYDMIPSDGMKFLQVNYETFVYEEADWLDTSVTVSDVKNSYTDYYPLYSDEISGISNHEQKAFDNAGLNQYAHMEGTGFWIFEIPEDTESVYLNISTLVNDSDSMDEWFTVLETDQTHVLRIDDL